VSATPTVYTRRNVLALLVAPVAAAALGTLLTSRPAAAATLVAYDFENGTSQGWTVSGPQSTSAVSAVNTTAAAQSGTHSLAVTLSGTTSSRWGSAYVVPPSTVVAGTQLSVWVKVPTNGLNAAIAMQDANNVWSNAAPVALPADGAWHQLTYRIPTAAAAPPRWVGIWFTAQSGVTWSGTVYVDEFQAASVSVAPPPSGPYAPPFPRLATVYSKPDLNSAQGKQNVARFNLWVTSFDWWSNPNYSDPKPAGVGYGQYLKQLNPNLIAVAYYHSSIFADNDWSWASGTTGYIVNGTTYNVDPRWHLFYAGSTLSNPVTASATTLPVGDLAQFNVNERAVIGGVGAQSAAEMVLITGKSGSSGAGTLTVQRGINSQNGRFGPVSHNPGEYVRSIAYAFGDPGNMLMNVTQTCPSTNVNPSLGNQTWAQFVGSFLGVKLAEPLSTSLDGVFFDNYVDLPSQIVYFLSRVDINNTNTASGIPTSYWTNGQVNVISQVRSRVGSAKLVMSNTGGSPANSGSILNGGMIEGVDETGANPFIGDVQGFYNSWMSAPLSPHVFIMDCSAHGSSLTAVQTNYQAMRFTLTWTLAQDAFYCYDEYWYSIGAHNTDWWYDEYDNAGQGRGYLGQALGPATQPIAGVLRRDFTNGISLSNTTTSAQTIALGGTFRKIRGTQAPTVNNGGTVTSVTLAAKDGIILLR
jgi:hypothetical protein